MYKKVTLRLLALWCCFIAMLFVVTHERTVGNLSLANMQRTIYASGVLVLVIFWVIIFKVAMEFKALKRSRYQFDKNSQGPQA